ncbi:MAG TPA: hemin uptake protein HemP [Paracoccaceae bacterium]|jgi:hemin uptake protein HemP|nr:hemin uptake protein HemP [Paracoccaceae bacterium]
MMRPEEHATRSAPPPGGCDTAVPRHDALDLTAGGTTAQIALHGQVYALRITRAGKLILTK